MLAESRATQLLFSWRGGYHASLGGQLGPFLVPHGQVCGGSNFPGAHIFVCFAFCMVFSIFGGCPEAAFIDFPCSLGMLRANLCLRILGCLWPPPCVSRLKKIDRFEDSLGVRSRISYVGVIGV